MYLIGNLGNHHWLFEEGVYLVLQFWVSSLKGNFKHIEWQT